MNQKQQADFEVTTRNGDPVALVEIKNVPKLSSPSAADIRRDFLDELSPAASHAYFLLIAQDSAFLWEPVDNSSSVEPTASFPMRPVLREYLGDDLLDRHLRGSELGIAVLQWLSDLTRGRRVVPQGQAAVARFADRLRGGTVHGGPGL